jgi:hypothetical protein
MHIFALPKQQYISQATIYCHGLNPQATMHKRFSQAASSHFFNHATRNTHFSQTTENQHETLKFAKHHNSLIPSPSQVTSEAITNKRMRLCIQLSCLATIHEGHMKTSTNNTSRNTRMMHMTQSMQRDFLNTPKEKQLSKTFQTTINRHFCSSNSTCLNQQYIVFD